MVVEERSKLIEPSAGGTFRKQRLGLKIWAGIMVSLIVQKPKGNKGMHRDIESMLCCLKPRNRSLAIFGGSQTAIVKNTGRSGFITPIFSDITNLTWCLAYMTDALRQGTRLRKV